MKSDAFWDTKEFLTGFNVRSYALFVYDSRLLVSRELIFGTELMKLPGGGLEHLEAPGAAIEREMHEELGLEVKCQDIFYVSPNFHRSFFRKQQLISLYWKIKPVGDVQIFEGEKLFEETDEKKHWFMWVPLGELNIDVFTHPCDKEALKKLLISV